MLTSNLRDITLGGSAKATVFVQYLGRCGQRPSVPKDTQRNGRKHEMEPAQSGYPEKDMSIFVPYLASCMVIKTYIWLTFVMRANVSR
jgi:hypothetical protein